MAPKDNPTSNLEFNKWLFEVARLNEFDGCTAVADIHLPCCQQHDFAYHTGYDARSVWEGNPKLISKAEADAQFRRCNQEESPLGVLSPLSWWRWLAVKRFGRSKKFSEPTLQYIKLPNKA